jgi:hypothetical protein
MSEIPINTTQNIEPDLKKKPDFFMIYRWIIFLVVIGICIQMKSSDHEALSKTKVMPNYYYLS